MYRTRKAMISFTIAAAMISLTACGSGGAKPLSDSSISVNETATDSKKAGVNTDSIPEGDITSENLSQVSEILRDAGLTNVDSFERWVKETEKEAAGKDEITGFSDADCRMTVMLLAGDAISYDKLAKSYKGDYLMFDLDAIENQDEYRVLQKKKDLFTTMFGEMPLPDSGFQNALSENWKKYGIEYTSDKCSIISIVLPTYEGKQAFVGHAGILIDCRWNDAVDSDYLFVEKLAFSEPFRISKIQSEKELIDMFSKRPDYTVEEDEPTPVVYRNGSMIGELTR